MRCPRCFTHELILVDDECLGQRFTCLCETWFSVSFDQNMILVEGHDKEGKQWTFRQRLSQVKSLETLKLPQLLLSS
jgi:hypothetical protein